MLVERKKEGTVFVVSAPSGGGKTTIIKEVVKLCPDLKRSISYTTRPRRSGEEDSVDYHFVTEREFQAMADSGRFLEWAKVYGHFYGTPEKPLHENIARGVDMALAIDIQGARKVREKFPHGVSIIIIPPSLDELERRLKSRETGEGRSLATRLESAREEISLASEYDYIIVNRRLEESVAQLKSIVTAERLRRCRYVINAGAGETGPAARGVD